MSDTDSKINAPVALVAIAGWLIPGAGYWLIGQRSRARATGFTVIAVYLAGLLIGGIRVVEVPGYNERGQRVTVEVSRRTEPRVWVMANSPLQEIKAKPWSIAQILAGPLGIVSGAVSVWSAEIPERSTGRDVDSEPGNNLPRSQVSHTPVNEAGTLYTAVAGMLNLLAIIDAAHRASQPTSPEDENDPSPSLAAGTSAGKEVA